MKKNQNENYHEKQIYQYNEESDQEEDFSILNQIKKKEGEKNSNSQYCYNSIGIFYFTFYFFIRRPKYWKCKKYKF